MPESAPSLLVAFLGTNDYVPVHYTLEATGSQDLQEMKARQREGATTKCEHRFVQSALLELLGEAAPRKVLLLVTDDARHGRPKRGRPGEREPANFALLEAELVRSGREVIPIDIPDGASEDALWEIFDRLVRGIPEGSEVVFDVTHGFRSLPVVGLLGFAFARHVRSVNVTGLYYGAFETLGEVNDVRARKHREHIEGGTPVLDAPLFDLTPMLELSRWSDGLSEWRTTGRGGTLGALVTEQRRRLGRTLGERMRPLNEVASAMAQLDAALALTRQDQIGSAAGQVVRALTVAPELEQHPSLAPLRLLLDRLGEQAGALEPTEAERDSSASYLIRVARWYSARARLHEAASLASEVVTSVAVEWAVRCGVQSLPREGTAGESADSSTEAFRTAARRALDALSGAVGGSVLRPGPPFDALQELTPPELATAFRFASDAIRTARNPLDHCWFGEHSRRRFNREALTAASAELREHLAAIEELVEVMKCSAPGQASAGGERIQSERRGFINLSSHPLREWPQEQVAAARALGFDEPFDYPAGELLVPPEADTGAVVDLARRIAADAIARGARAAHVAGEPVLVSALVRELGARGVRCFSATTAREVVSSARPDGSVETRRTFRFVRWREYG